MRNPLILFLAALGLFAIIYGAWHLYEQQRAAEEAHQTLTQPYPNDIFNKNAPPPPQP